MTWYKLMPSTDLKITKKLTMLLEHLKFKNRYTLETLVSNLDRVPALFLGVFLQAGCKFK